jgi:hypothetical protein
MYGKINKKSKKRKFKKIKIKIVLSITLESILTS